jgi:hypothetical protein
MQNQMSANSPLLKPLGREQQSDTDELFLRRPNLKLCCPDPFLFKRGSLHAALHFGRVRITPQTHQRRRPSPHLEPNERTVDQTRARVFGCPSLIATPPAEAALLFHDRRIRAFPSER